MGRLAPMPASAPPLNASLPPSHLPNQQARDISAIFRSLSGSWHVHRTIRNHHPSKKALDGTFDGTATFLPRAPSALPSETGVQTPEEGTQEYLYREHGTFTTATGASFPAQMKYVYQHHPSWDRISAWRVKAGAASAAPEEGEVESWFHDITLLSDPAPASDAASEVGGRVWFGDYAAKGDCVAKGSEHLCVRDTYKPYYRFCFGPSGELEGFGIGYDVSGPEKGYVSEAWFDRI